MTTQTIQIPVGDSVTIVAVAAGSGTPPPGGGTEPPPGGGTTPPPNPEGANVFLNWQSPTRQKTGAIDCATPIFVHWTNGGVSSTNDLPHVTVVETGGDAPPRPRSATLHEESTGAQVSTPLPMAGQTITCVFALGTGLGGPYYPVLKLNTGYYLRIVTDPSQSGRADMDADLIHAGNL